MINSCVNLEVYWNSTDARLIGNTNPSRVVLLSSWYTTSTVVSGMIDRTAGRFDSQGANSSSLKTHQLGTRFTGITDSMFFLVVTSVLE